MISRLAPAALLLLGTSSAFAGDPKTEAREHYAVGLQAAERGDYRLALGQFLASFEAYPHPSTARNIAKAYEDFGDLKRALTWYRKFQELAPNRTSEVAEDVIRVTEALLEGATPARPVVATPPPAPAVPESESAMEAELAALKARLAELEAAKVSDDATTAQPEPDAKQPPTP